MLRAALRRRSFDEATMVAVPCALAAFWWSEARPSAERRAAQQAPECAYRPSEELIGADVASRLDRDGVVEVRAVLGPCELAAARRDLEALVGRPGAWGGTGNATDVRQDAVAWLRPTTAAVAAEGGQELEHHGEGLEHCVRLLRGVAHALAEESGVKPGKLLLVPLDCQLAAFRGDKLAGYRAHRDTAPSGWAAFAELGLLGFLRARDCRRRAVTAIPYLNDPDWDSGGELACYIDADVSDNDGGTAKKVRRIVPRGGTLLLFDSTTLLHEVEPSRKDRYALTCWLWDQDS